MTNAKGERFMKKYDPQRMNFLQEIKLLQIMLK